MAQRRKSPTNSPSKSEAKTQETKVNAEVTPQDGPNAVIGNLGIPSTGVREKTVTEMTNGTKREDY